MVRLAGEAMASQLPPARFGGTPVRYSPNEYLK